MLHGVGSSNRFSRSGAAHPEVYCSAAVYRPRLKAQAMATQPRVIKAGQLLGVQPAPFNAHDTLDETQKRVLEAQQEIERYQNAAQAEAKSLLEKARQDGYKKGYEEGLAKAAVEAKAKHQAALDKELATRMASITPALSKAIESLALARDQWIGEWEQAGVQLACAVAARIVRQQTVKSNEVASRAIADAFALVGRCPAVTLYLNPADVHTLDLQRDKWNSMTQAIGEVKFVADPSITPGGCRLEYEFGSIDSTIEKQLERIEQELTGHSGE